MAYERIVNIYTKLDKLEENCITNKTIVDLRKIAEFQHIGEKVHMIEKKLFDTAKDVFKNCKSSIHEYNNKHDESLRAAWMLLENGIGCGKNENFALRHLELAANAGSKDASKKLDKTKAI
ncbi:18012_t:CDS:2, partial [Racocetra persica]